MKTPNVCPCGSNKQYENCCEIYHKNLQAPTAEALMRSRYSAFVFGLVDYLVKTTHPNYRYKGLEKEIASRCKTVAWRHLKIISTWQGDIHDVVGKVFFEATFVQEGKEGIHQEHSRFKRFKHQWMYTDAQGS